MPGLVDNHNLRARTVLLALRPRLAREDALALGGDFGGGGVAARDVHPVVFAVQEEDGDAGFAGGRGRGRGGRGVGVGGGCGVRDEPLAADAVDAADEGRSRKGARREEIAQGVLAAAALAEERVAVVVQGLGFGFGEVREAAACPARDEAWA